MTLHLVEFCVQKQPLFYTEENDWVISQVCDSRDNDQLITIFPLAIKFMDKLWKKSDLPSSMLTMCVDEAVSTFNLNSHQ